MRRGNNYSGPRCAFSEARGASAQGVSIEGSSRPSVEKVTARLDGCDHPEVRPDGDTWACVRCDQWFGPIFTETPRRS